MNLTKEEFQRVLAGAVAGRHDDLTTILELYMPLINRYSMWDDKLDEDLRQYLLIHIALNISKFSL